MLQIKSLYAQFETTTILKGVDLTVKQGEVHLILGPNGSGKSTLGRIIIGDPKYQKTEGKILFENEDFDNFSVAERAQKGFFYSFQSPPEIDGVRVWEFLLAAKKAKNASFVSTFKFKKELQHILENLRLSPDFIDRPLHCGFSGGERKKIEMAALLILDPKCAFLDEIDSGVDVDTIRQIGANLRKFLEDKSKSLVLVSHSEKLLTEVLPTHVHIFCRGKIIKSGGIEIMETVHQKGFDSFLDEKPKGLTVLS